MGRSKILYRWCTRISSRFFLVLPAGHRDGKPCSSGSVISAGTRRFMISAIMIFKSMSLVTPQWSRFDMKWSTSVPADDTAQPAGICGFSKIRVKPAGLLCGERCLTRTRTPPKKLNTEITSEVSRGKPEGRFLGPLRTAALIALLVGAGGSIGLLLRAGQRTPRLLLVILIIWVLSPFMALVLADVISKRWPVLTRATLYSATLVVTLGSLAIYGYDALRPRKAQAAFWYVLVPPASWLLILVVVPIAGFISGRLARRDDGA